MSPDVDFSQRCVSAGVVALLGCVLAFTVLTFLYQAPHYDALGEYIMSRSALLGGLELVEADPCLQEATTNPDVIPAAATMGIEQLSNYVCGSDYFPKKQREGKSETNQNKTTPKARVSKVSPQSPGLPDAPKGFAITTDFTSARTLVKALRRAADPVTLRQARLVSARFDESIYKWLVHISSLSSARMAVRYPGIIGISVPDRKPPTVKEEQQMADSYASNLTLADVHDLAHYELLTANDFDAALADFHRINFAGLGQSALTLLSATLFTEIALVVPLLWFWLNLREAVATGQESLPGTIFVMFSRTVFSKVIFGVLLSTPAILAALVAYQSETYRLQNVPFCVLTVLFCNRIDGLMSQVEIDVS
jgi:hypothetical protein